MKIEAATYKVEDGKRYVVLRMETLEFKDGSQETYCYAKLNHRLPRHRRHVKTQFGVFDRLLEMNLVGGEYNHLPNAEKCASLLNGG